MVNEDSPVDGGTLHGRSRIWKESNVWLEVGLLRDGVPALEFGIGSRTFLFALSVNHLRTLAGGRAIILTSPSAECEISPHGALLNVDFHAYDGRTRRFELAIDALRLGLRRVIDPPRKRHVLTDGRTEIRVALTDLVWSSVKEDGIEVVLEGNIIVVRVDRV